MSTKEQFIILIYGLYFIRCIKIINKNDILLIYNYKKINIDFPSEYFCTEQQSFIYLNTQLSHLNPSKFAVVLRNVAIITFKSSFLLTILSICAIFSKIIIKASIAMARV